MGRRPNKQLQTLWMQHGENDFELRAVKCLEYDDLAENHTEELETLRELCLIENPKAKKL